MQVLDKGYVLLLDWMGDDLAVVNAARASFDKRSNWVTWTTNNESDMPDVHYELAQCDAKLIAYLAKNGHTSPFRHCTLQFEIKAPLMVARQWWKYVVGSDHTMDGWNEQCFPAAQPIKLWNQGTLTVGELLQKQRRIPRIRSMNEAGEIVPGSIKEIRLSGNAPVWRVVSELGCAIEATSNHRFLTPAGWRELGALKVGESVYMNGQAAYRDKDWLELLYVQQNVEQKDIAQLAGCSVHTIRSWVRKHKLQQNQVARMQLHNATYGVFGKGKTKFTDTTIAARSLSTGNSQRGVPKSVSGNLHHAYKGDKATQNAGNARAQHSYASTQCVFCVNGVATSRIELHHRDGNTLNNSISNIISVCTAHHHILHGHSVLLKAHPVPIKSIEYCGVHPVYDIEMCNEPTLVVGQFIVHNSRRYVDSEPEFYQPEQWRKRAATNKQGSTEESAFTPYNDEYADQALASLIETGTRNYRWALEQGVAPEQARLFLPAYAMYTTWQWTASLQSVAHFLNQRMDEHAQWEIRQYAKAVYELVEPNFPVSIANLVEKPNE